MVGTVRRQRLKTVVGVEVEPFHRGKHAVQAYKSWPVPLTGPRESSSNQINLLETRTTDERTKPSHGPTV